MSEYAPGPWKYELSNDVGPNDDYYIEFFEVQNTSGKKIAQVEEQDHARLIAAAPDMLYALEDLLATVAAHDGPKSIDELGVIGRAMTTIKKAKGEE